MISVWVSYALNVRVFPVLFFYSGVIFFLVFYLAFHASNCWKFTSISFHFQQLPVLFHCRQWGKNGKNNIARDLYFATGSLTILFIFFFAFAYEKYWNRESKIIEMKQRKTRTRCFSSTGCWWYLLLLLLLCS